MGLVIAVVIAFVVGTFVGFAACAILTISSLSDDELER